MTFERPWVLLALDVTAGAPPYEAAVGGGALAVFARGRLELEPSAALVRTGAGWRVPCAGRFLGLLTNAPEPGARSGPAALPVVVEVPPGTPAAVAGVEAGDRLASIDGFACAGLEPRRWNEKLWVREGQVMVELVKPDGKVVRVALP